MNPAILYEDDDIVAVDKPAGLLVHPDGYAKDATLADWVLERYPDTTNVGEPMKLRTGELVRRPGIVHRLDKETSGVVLVAKNTKAFEHLKHQFQNREVEKKYRAFVWGTFKEAEGEINKSIGRSKSDFRKWSAERGAGGELREALTQYRVIVQNDAHAYLEIMPRTGRTHQIRVHMKSISRPVVGDMLYAPKRPFALGFERLALHARSIAFKDLAGKPVAVEAPLPRDFLAAEAVMGVLQ